MNILINGLTLELLQGDITELPVDAIVNAANSELILGSGVAGAIARKGGPTIQAECNEIGSCPVGGAVITDAGSLPASYVIHAVGPRYGEGDEERKLASATRASLQLAKQRVLTDMAFPAISTGVFGYPMADCARIMLRTILDFAQNDHGSVRRVTMCLWDSDAMDVFTTELSRQFSQ
jgi:O-acetyl-ADP-ribose deacetylase (regulator of RNase III)